MLNICILKELITVIRIICYLSRKIPFLATGFVTVYYFSLMKDIVESDKTCQLVSFYLR